MRNQEQTKDSNCYNNRLVLVLVFIALYVIIPVLLIILKDEFYYYMPSRIFVWALGGIASLCLVMIVIDLLFKRTRRKLLIRCAIDDVLKKKCNESCNDAVKFAISQALIDKCKVQNSTKDYEMKDIVSNALNDDEVKNAISGALNKDDVIKALSTALKDNGEIEKVITATFRIDASNVDGVTNAITIALLENIKVKDTIVSTLKVGEIIKAIKAAIDKNNDLEKAINDAFGGSNKEQAKTAIKGALDSDKVKLALSALLKDRVLSILDESLKTEIRSYLKDALNKEKDAQKYRLAERVVGEICKNNKIDANAINSVQSLIDGIINLKECCLDITEDADKYIFEITDMNCKKLRLFNYKMSDKMYVSSPNGSFNLRNGIIIEIQGNMIQSVTKKEKTFE